MDKVRTRADSDENSPEGGEVMDHVTTARRMYDLINANDIDGFAAQLADDFVEHEETPGLAPTKAGVKDFFRAQLAAFPDMRMQAQDVIASGDKVAIRVRCSGTFRAEFMGMPATGKHFDVELIDIMGFGPDGLVHEHWGVMDSLAMMQQLGATPAGSPG